MDYYATLNLIEAAFWIVVGLTIVATRNLYAEKYGQLVVYAFVVLALFGISDILEARIGNFLDTGMEWLFVWKAINVIALIGGFMWYLFLRKR